MNITLIRYERVHNLGNYESERIGVEVVVNEDESADDAVQAAKQFVSKSLGLTTAEKDEILFGEDDNG